MKKKTILVRCFLGNEWQNIDQKIFLQVHLWNTSEKEEC